MKKEALSWWRMHLEDDPTRRPHAHVKAQIDGVERFLALEPRSRVLDLGCGAGRRTIELARRGHRVLGVDPDERALLASRLRERLDLPVDARDAARGRGARRGSRCLLRERAEGLRRGCRRSYRRKRLREAAKALRGRACEALGGGADLSQAT